MSLALRTAWISNPRLLLFDEHYYVNAARKILGLRLPADAIYATAAPGLDPNFAHPPLGKVLISLGIRTFGDVPLGWRFTSLVFGSYAILALYWLARTAGMSRWHSLGAASLMAADPMFFIHGRIGTLEILVLTFMLVAAAVYLSGRPALAGLVVGVGACIKLVCLFLLPALLVLELLKAISSAKAARRSGSSAATPRSKAVRGRLKRISIVGSTAVFGYLGVLQALDMRFTTFDTSLAHTYAMLTSISVGNLDDSVIDQIPPQGRSELRIATTDPGTELPPAGPVIQQQGQRLGLAPASSPVEWLLNQEPIIYYRAPTFRGEVASWSRLGLKTADATVFRALINPAIIVLAIPSLAYCGLRLWRRRDQEAFLPVAWFTGVWGFFLVADALRPESSGHLYYMVIVLPAIYLAVAQLFEIERLKRLIPWYALVVAAFFLWNFPFKTWGGV